MTWGRVRLTGGFVLLWAVLMYVEAGALLIPVWTAALLHECGHLIALKLCGGRVELWEFSAGGVCMRVADTHTLSYGKELLCTLTGPAVSMLCALIFSFWDGMMMLAGICAVQGVFNLLPASGLDGGRILELILRWRERPLALLKATTLLTAGCAAVLGVLVFFWSGYNITLLLAGAYASIALFGGTYDQSAIFAQGAQARPVRGRRSEHGR